MTTKKLAHSHTVRVQRKKLYEGIMKMKKKKNNAYKYIIESMCSRWMLVQFVVLTPVTRCRRRLVDRILCYTSSVNAYTGECLCVVHAEMLRVQCSVFSVCQIHSFERHSHWHRMHYCPAACRCFATRFPECIHSKRTSHMIVFQSTPTPCRCWSDFTSD